LGEDGGEVYDHLIENRQGAYGLMAFFLPGMLPAFTLDRFSDGQVPPDQLL
jgi:hypothetical protein